ncbi:MAG: protein translocase subunit SecD [Candidatus Pacebacteria bacterium CG_4_10_14_3_um_filter_34_15]|nr:protein translocase subunit SecD [Candidatus Pacearchaeota archaeon]NCQ65620.1 protein translocase subunit SecD [Candidatus Paceibacterota bacterium]OIO44915.1 MAG: protein-export membrane protein SecD [Candidatus Pacebacteria bacterium CG1_02_43_31]PIQ80544.1 MAG: protein translocase subunit SecD [Candidatus Pacebacteria bacterium CG11_big_fil_rev_8_21_14_0_20_34_55]PIX81590.1 MAG: protein translocase subunit SecD [Candidatus Pacebacteria bacterium CG_4_10_14_3_um_filter_34_15]PJC44179.1 M
MKNPVKVFIFIIFLTFLAGFVALPESWPVSLNVFGRNLSFNLSAPIIDFNFFGKQYYKKFELKKGLDVQGGIQVVLQADMSQIEEADRVTALESAKEIILRRVDLYGLAEPVVKTLITENDYRIVVELPGLNDPQQALELVGQTALLEFQLVRYIEVPALVEPNFEVASDEAQPQTVSSVTLEPTGLSGSQLKRSNMQFDQTTGEPTVLLQFNDEGRELFANLTTENTGESLAIVIDKQVLMAPVIQSPIINGQATITGKFSLEEAQKLSIQLNAGALPVPITVLEQRNIDATLGAESIQKSTFAGLVGIALVMLFMIIYYGVKGFLASIALIIYAILTLATYKIIGVTMTLPGVAGLLLSVGMAVDSNILIFERMKEELRLEKPFAVALELGFGRAWDSIKDANLATIITALILINPMDLSFLNSGGMVRGFGITLLIGVLLSLFTGVVVTRTLMRLFLKGAK